ncbi:protein-glutamine gamma-glutamyltransferase [Halobacillus alkaliphilus]|uniref:Protein-glutamine gamma-glutamyltransferase n=1 Tax=Halobacillus alkaliphilus TaxID=396056 RepID=A0A1I2Q1Z3_9BACI|nr:protein-glutamine gamma-glutamyltransferase [Halobacillus alkaliphilus]SFG21930.1 protein-glutamine gamma-glutamyltransferase [Halobacillus alkaliphilus]
MIQVSGRPFQPNHYWNADELENVITEAMQEAQDIYSFSSERELSFVIKSRKNIIRSAQQMDEGEAAFATFKGSRCNPEYWNLTEAGGFLLKPQVRPSDAMYDIFKNSNLYKFECATACVINFYHGILLTIGSLSFNNLFPRLYLYSWYTDEDLGLYSFHANHYVPGDVVYFNNPDFDPDTPWFRGINAIAMGNGRFFGHGFSIRTANQMIEALNRKRKPDSQQSAYLASLITRPSFNQLANLSGGGRVHKMASLVVHHNKNSISYINYLFELSYQLKH